MSVTPAEYAAIKADLANVHYAAMLALPTLDQQNAAIAADLNTTPSWNAGDKIFDRQIDTKDFINCLVDTEFLALTQQQRDYILLLTQLPIVDMSKGAIRTALANIFPAGGANTTKQNLNQIQKRNASRLEFLLDRQGATIEPWEVARARAS